VIDRKKVRSKEHVVGTTREVLREKERPGGRRNQPDRDVQWGKTIIFIASKEELNRPSALRPKISRLLRLGGEEGKKAAAARKSRKCLCRREDRLKVGIS